MRLLPRIFGRRSPAVLTLGAGASLADIERVEEKMLRLPQVNVPVLHRFAPGAYVRSVVMPADTYVIGHEHTTEHFNFVMRGRALVLCEGRVELIVAPCIFVSTAGVRKVLHVLEEMEWATVHPTHETDLTKLDAALIRKSESFQIHAAEAAALAEARAALEGGV
jgi:hypothetical protein